MRDLAGVAALVTGGASGLGLATARGLAATGARVAALDLTPGEAEPGILHLACDVADEGSVVAALDAAEAEHGAARIVVNSAGVPGSMRLVGRDGPVDMGRFAQVIGVNLLGTVSVMTKAAARMMALEPLGQDGERGVIVNTASITAYEGQIGQGAYVASKGAIAAMTIQAAREFAAKGVRVLAIAPGLFKTPMASEVPPEVVEAITSDSIFPRRFGEPEDFADLCLSMIRNPMLNGEVIRLDAGVRLRAS
ncbi:SDR family NAD(P)-dependent oxidoreductase [Ostreiculturibacter nitratireducens]|uniref:SDR family NAD(P)-dependent oxidoreductase n=1 Tax=Ostreiculturibacter nitratireducens TaxID=3075226 RepID=UPI0031B60260